MFDDSSPLGGRGYELLLEHCAVVARATSARTPAFERLEETLGGELTRLLVVALARQRAVGVRV